MISDCKLKCSLCLLLLLTASYTASARLGETQAEMEARYGKPSQNDGGMIAGGTRSTYILKSTGIVAYFVDGKCESEQYYKLSGDAFTNDEIRRLLNNNSMGSKWRKEAVQGGMFQAWGLESREASARYFSRTLSITTRKGAEYFKRQGLLIKR